jgi:hypothetical protein
MQAGKSLQKPAINFVTVCFVLTCLKLKGAAFVLWEISCVVYGSINIIIHVFNNEFIERVTTIDMIPLFKLLKTKRLANDAIASFPA